MIPSTPNSKPPKYGFQKSENTRAVATIYQHHKDPMMVYGRNKKDTFTLKGNRGDHDDPSVVSIMTSKNINNASGTFTIILKPSLSSLDLFRTISDDDWVDIAFWVDNKPYHNFRGLIDEINRVKAIGNNGSTVTTYNITGRCFGKIWESTSIWFSPYANSIATQVLGLTMFNGTPPELGGSPGKTAIAFLKAFLEQSQDLDGPNWYPPSSLPGIKGSNFISNIEFNLGSDGVHSKYFQNLPARREFNQKFIMPEGVLWDLAKEFSDPMFTELYTDYLPNGDPLNKHFDSPVSDGDGKMTVVMRDRPFPVLPTSAPIGYKNTWDKLPMHSIYPQEIQNSNISKGGYERFNVFFVASRLHQESINNHALESMKPLWDKESIRIHGLRRKDIQISTFPDDDNTDRACALQRQILRDWYCLNPYYLSGTIMLAHSRPDIHIGTRINIPGITLNNKEVLPEENYYAEEVGHTWTFGQGARTTLGVTRGWIGNDDSYMKALAAMVDKYSLGELEDIVL